MEQQVSTPDAAPASRSGARAAGEQSAGDVVRAWGGAGHWITLGAGALGLAAVGGAVPRARRRQDGYLGLPYYCGRVPGVRPARTSAQPARPLIHG